MTSETSAESAKSPSSEKQKNDSVLSDQNSVIATTSHAQEKDSITPTSSQSNKSKIDDNENMNIQGSDNVNEMSEGINNDNTESLKRKADETDENSNSNSNLNRQKRMVKKVPNKLPAWFSFDSVDPREIEYMPDFFASDPIPNSKTAQDYIRIRNFIVNLYESNPFVYLSATECRKKLSGEVQSTLKVFGFLDAFNVINFNVRSDCRPSINNICILHTNKDSKSLLKLSSTNEEENSSTTSTTPHQTTASGDEEKISEKRMTTDIDNTTSNNDIDTILEEPQEWSVKMDNTLRHSVIPHKGDWVAIAEEINNEIVDSEYEDIWKPTPQECLSHFLTLPLTMSTTPSTTTTSSTTTETTGKSTTKSTGKSSAFNSKSTNSTTSSNSSSSPKEISQQKILYDKIIQKAAIALGCYAAKKVISDIISTSTLSQEISPSSTDVNKIESKIILGTTAAAISIMAKNDMIVEENKLKSLLDDYIVLRLAALEEKAKVIVDIDRMIDIERDRLAVDRRDVQIQRAQVAFLRNSKYTII